MQTDPVGAKDDLNLYAYTSNEPANSLDPLGRWSTEGHNRIINAALSGQLNAREINRVQKGSAWADKRYVLDNAVHSQRDYGQTVQAMETVRAQFVADKLAQAAEAGREGDIKEMLNLFGQAMHPIMDKYSPAHNIDGEPSEYSAADTFSQGHSPLESMGRERAADVTPEIEEAVTAEIRTYFDELLQQASQGDSQSRGDVKKVLCTGSRVLREKC